MIKNIFSKDILGFNSCGILFSLLLWITIAMLWGYTSTGISSHIPSSLMAHIISIQTAIVIAPIGIIIGVSSLIYGSVFRKSKIRRLSLIGAIGNSVVFGAGLYFLITYLPGWF